MTLINKFFPFLINNLILKIKKILEEKNIINFKNKFSILRIALKKNGMVDQLIFLRSYFLSRPLLGMIVSTSTT
jgi:hypothetical protein